MLRKIVLSSLLFLAFTHTAHASLNCNVSVNSWTDGYVANVVVTNNGDSTLDGWDVQMSFSQPPAITSAWSVSLDVNENQVTASNVAWNAQLDPGEAAHFGFIGSHDGEFVEPSCQDNLQSNSLESYLKNGVRNHLEARYYPPPLGGSSSSSSSSSSGGQGPVPVPTQAPGAGEQDDITNTQEEGVDEADIIESDGTNLFVVRGLNRSSYSTSSSSTSSSSTSSSSTSSTSGGVEREQAEIKLAAYATDAVNGRNSKLSELSLPYDVGWLNFSGAYLRKTDSGNSLAMVGETTNYQYDGWDYFYNYYQRDKKLSVVIADVDDPTSMEEVERISFDGSLVSSRRIDNELFIVSRYSPSLTRLGIALTSGAGSDNLARLDSLTLTQLLPQIYDSEGGSAPLFSAEKCVQPEASEFVDTYYGSLLVLTKINLDDTSEIKSLCLPASASDIYSSQNAVYAFDYSYYYQTKIHKIAIDEEMEYRDSLLLPGYIPCREKSYCFGEKDGVLSVLYSEPSWAPVPTGPPSSSSSSSSSTSSSSSGGSFVAATPYRLALINEAEGSGELEVLSKIPNESRPASIGKVNEQVYGVRHFGDHAYVVTFERTDPLYAIDLSNPEDPFIAGEIEVSGFSQYLHPVGENLLIGVGLEATDTGPALFQGVKVELFDVSDPNNLRSLGSEVVGKRGSSTTLLNDPRAFAFKNDNYGMRFSIPIRVHNILPPGGDPTSPTQHYGWDHTGLYVFQIDEAQGEAELSPMGVLKVDSLDTIYYDRGVLDQGAVHYLHNYNLFSSLLSGLDLE